MAETKLNKEQIEEQNRRAVQLNTKRNQMIGQKQSAEEQLARMATAYEQRYGVKLTPANLQAEYNEQSGALHAAYADQAALIASVEAGDYKKAAAPVITTPEPVALGASTGRVNASVPNQAATPQPSFDGDLGVPVVATGGFVGVPDVPTGAAGDDEDESERPFTPTGWG